MKNSQYIIIEEMQIKMTERYYCTPTKMVKFKIPSNRKLLVLLVGV